MKNKKVKELDLKIVEKYIAGVTNDEENHLIESFFIHGEHRDDLRNILKSEWNMMNNEPDQKNEKLGHLLDHIHHLIRMREYQKRNSFIHKAANIYIKAAAILILPFIVIAGIAYNNLRDNISTVVHIEKNPVKNETVTNTIIAPLGARVAFTLPDSSTGMLNSGSRLTYSIPFADNRNIDLQGEAWFEVKHDINNPFVISAGNSKVKVLGTSFNINAYPEEDYIEVVLTDGEVEFSDNSNNSRIMMHPSEKLIFQNGTVTKSVTDPAKYNGWTEGKLIFRGDLMAEVGRRIERWYNVKFEIGDSELRKYSFRGTFEDDSLEEVLELLSMTSPISYKITPRKILTDGTYQKEKVSIYLIK